MQTFYTRDEVVTTARKFLGVVRFRHQGRSADGVDCAGLVLLTLRTCRPDIYDLWRDLAISERRPPFSLDAPYGLVAPPLLALDFANYIGRAKPIKQVRPADLVVFINGRITSTAIASECHDAPHIIAAFSNARMVTERALSGTLKSWVHSVYELRGIGE